MLWGSHQGRLQSFGNQNNRFTIALKFILDELKIFKMKEINWIISLAISFSAIILLSVIAPFVSALSIFFISITKIKGTRGLLIGIDGAVLYLIFSLFLSFGI